MHHRSRSRLAPFIACLALLGSAQAQTVVNSTYVGRYYGPYSDQENWSPAEVPNDSPSRHYDVFLGPGAGVVVDIDATISNLTLPAGDDGAGLSLYDRTFTVTGTTFASRPRVVVHSEESQGSRLNLGTLSSFSAGELSGDFDIGSHANGSATLQSAGSQPLRLRNAQFTLRGRASFFVDENGADRLSRLTEIDALSTFVFSDQTATTAETLRVDGILELGGSSAATPTIFSASASLANFDQSTRTITGGVFQLRPGDSSFTDVVIQLRFAGADIVNNGSTLILAQDSRVTDLNGADGLRNLARNLPGGSLTLEKKRMTAPGNFSNDGTLTLKASSFTIVGALKNLASATRTLQSGTYRLDGELSPGEPALRFLGADIVRNAAFISLRNKAAMADQSGNDALRNFVENLSSGTFIVGLGQEFSTTAGFTSAGHVETESDRGAISGEAPVRPDGTFTVVAGADYAQTAGRTLNNGSLTATNVRIMGGSFAGEGLITGDVAITEATIFPGGSINGSLTLSPGSNVSFSIGQYSLVNHWDLISGTAALSGTLAVGITTENYIPSTAVFTLLTSGQPLSGTFANAPDGARVQTTEGSGSFVVRYETNTVKLTEFQANPRSAQLLNISTRAYVKPGNDPYGEHALIGGFIITGTEPKTVIIRGLGPSLARFGLNPSLPDPMIELHQSEVGLIASNDDWTDSQRTEIEASGLMPDNPRESAIKATLNAGVYTVVLQDRSGAPGTAMVEVYDISRGAQARLANISTRGWTDSNNVLIGGIIAGGDGPADAEVIVRALGPTLRMNGVFNALADPTLELRDSNGALLAFNDDWSENYEQLGAALGDFRPFNSRECALRVSLPRGNYTALVRGKNGSSGTALVEFYDLRR